MKSGTLAILVAALVAGCLETPEGRELSETEPHGSNSEGPPSSGGQNVTQQLTSFQILRMNSCKGAHTHANVPATLVGAVPPRTWGESSTPLTELWVNIHHCEIFSLDGFERGPVNMVLETHGNRDSPEACRGDYTSSEILTKIFFDDWEIVRHVREVYSMPAEFAAVTLESHETDAIPTFSATISPAGLPASEFSEIRAVADADGTLVVKLRRFWENQHGGISYMDFTDDYTGPAQLVSPVMTGSLNEPFLYQKLGTNVYTPLGGFYHSGSIQASIKQFRDLACAESLSSF